ncbi:MAG: hypothetical protein HY719_13090 [Planctomycetes bacterium]|nr:hypothetical protein [Planctomycetota bacterium]
MTIRGVFNRFAVVVAVIVVVAAPRGVARADEQLEYAQKLFAKYPDLAIQELERIAGDGALSKKTRRDALHIEAQMYAKLLETEKETAVRKQHQDKIDEITKRMNESADIAADNPIDAAMLMVSQAKADLIQAKAIDAGDDAGKAEQTRRREKAKEKFDKAYNMLKTVRDEKMKVVDKWEEEAKEELPPEAEEAVVAWYNMNEVRYEIAKTFVEDKAARKKVYEEICVDFNEFLMRFELVYASYRAYILRGRIYLDLGEKSKAQSEFAIVLGLKVDKAEMPKEVQDYIMELKRDVYGIGTQTALDAGDWDSVIKYVDSFFAEFPQAKNEARGKMMLFTKLEAMCNKAGTGNKGMLKEAYDIVKQYSDDADANVKNRANSVLSRIITLDKTEPRIVPLADVFRGGLTHFNKGRYSEAMEAFGNVLSSISSQDDYERFAPEIHDKYAEIYARFGRRLETAHVQYLIAQKFLYFTKLTAIPESLKGKFKEVYDMNAYPARAAMEASRTFALYLQRTGNPYFKNLQGQVDQYIIANFSHIPDVSASKIYEKAAEDQKERRFIDAVKRFLDIPRVATEYYLKAQPKAAESYYFYATDIREGKVANPRPMLPDEKDILDRAKKGLESDPDLTFVSDAEKKRVLAFAAAAEKEPDPMRANYLKARFFAEKYFYWVYAADVIRMKDEIRRMASQKEDEVLFTELADTQKAEIQRQYNAYMDLIAAGKIQEAALKQPEIHQFRIKQYQKAMEAESVKNAGEYQRMIDQVNRDMRQLARSRVCQANTIRVLYRPLEDKIKDLTKTERGKTDAKSAAPPPPKSEALKAMEAEYVAVQWEVISHIDDFWRRYGWSFQNDSDPIRPAVIKIEFATYIDIAEYTPEQGNKYVAQADEVLAVYEEKFSKNEGAEGEKWVTLSKKVLGATLDKANWEKTNQIIKVYNDIRALAAKVKNQDEGFTTKAQIAAEAGKIGDAPFSKLCADLTAKMADNLSPPDAVVLSQAMAARLDEVFIDIQRQEKLALKYLYPILMTDKDKAKTPDEIKKVKEAAEAMANRLLLIGENDRGIQLLEWVYADKPLLAPNRPEVDPNGRENSEEIRLRFRMAQVYLQRAKAFEAAERAKNGGALPARLPPEWRDQWSTVIVHVDRLMEFIARRDDAVANGRKTNYENVIQGLIVDVITMSAECNEALALNAPDPARNYKTAKENYVELIKRVREYSAPWWEYNLRLGVVLKAQNDATTLDQVIRNRNGIDPKFGGRWQEFRNLVPDNPVWKDPQFKRD